MYNIGIIDDEKLARETIKNLIKVVPLKIDILFEASNADEAIEYINKYLGQLDAIFLDINLGDKTGFDVLECFKERNFAVIFVTAYDEFAIKAFKFSALNYILKPVSLNEINESIQRIANHKNNKDLIEQYELLKKIIVDREDKIKKICISHGSDKIFINLNEIIRIEANSNYSWIILANNNKYLVSKTLKEYEALLVNLGFIRIHQSYIINIKYVVKIKNNKILLKDNTILPISRSRKKQIIEIFTKTQQENDK